MSQISESAAFELQFPEQYPWEDVDSIVAAAAGTKIAARIREELRTQPAEDCLYTPGLRLALKILAAATQEI